MNVRRATEHCVCRPGAPVVIAGRPFKCQAQALLLYARDDAACRDGSNTDNVARFARQHDSAERGTWRAMYMLDASKLHSFEAQ